MKMFVISDNVDTLTGMRLVGVDGVVVHTETEVIEAVEKCLSDSTIGIIMITEVLCKTANEYVSEKMSKTSHPLFLQIPDRHGFNGNSFNMSEFISSAIGIKL